MSVLRSRETGWGLGLWALRGQALQLVLELKGEEQEEEGEQ